MPSTPSRRRFLAGSLAGLSGLLAGCVGDDGSTARCSGRGEGPIELEVGTIRGDEQVALGIMIPAAMPADPGVDAILVRDRDGRLLSTVPTEDNRHMSDLDPDIHPRFGGSDGELYAIPLGPPPQHHDLRIELVDPEDTVLVSAEYRFNCYASDGTLP